MLLSKIGFVTITLAALATLGFRALSEQGAAPTRRRSVVEFQRLYMRLDAYSDAQDGDGPSAMERSGFTYVTKENQSWGVAGQSAAATKSRRYIHDVQANTVVDSVNVSGDIAVVRVHREMVCRLIGHGDGASGALYHTTGRREDVWMRDGAGWKLARETELPDSAADAPSSLPPGVSEPIPARPTS